MGSIKVRRVQRTTARTTDSVAVDHPFLCRGDSVHTKPAAASHAHAHARIRTHTHDDDGADSESNVPAMHQHVSAVEYQPTLQVGTWTSCEAESAPGTVTAASAEFAASDANYFTLQPNAFSKRRQILDKKRRRRSRQSVATGMWGSAHSSTSSTSSRASRTSSDGGDMASQRYAAATVGDGQLIMPASVQIRVVEEAGSSSSKLGATTPTNAPTNAPTVGTAAVPTAHAHEHDPGFVEVRMRKKRNTSTITRSRLTESICRVKREWSVRKSGGGSGRTGSSGVEDDVRTITKIMFSKYVSAEDTLNAQAEELEETELERMIRAQNALFEKQLVSTTATASNATRTIARINAGLATQLVWRGGERTASICTPSRPCARSKPVHLPKVGTVAKATPVVREATPNPAVAVAIGDGDTAENMGFGDLITISDDDSDAGDDGDGYSASPTPGTTTATAAALHATTSTTPRVEPSAVEQKALAEGNRVLPHRPAPWSRRWKPSALEKWRKKRDTMLSSSSPLERVVSG